MPESCRHRSCLQVVGGAWIPLTLLMTLIGIELLIVLVLNDGKLIYTLDDPYIHLALAENICNGHYGVNIAEYSAPSSSAIWPLIMAPFCRLSIFEYVPLILNSLAAALTLWLYHWVVISDPSRDI